MTTATLDDPGGLQSVFDEIAETFDGIDYAPVLGEFADELKDIHQNYFLGSFGPDGRDWKPWYWRDPGVSNDHPTLIARGRLRDSLLTQSSDHVEEIGTRELAWGTSVPYAGMHNFGGQSVVGGQGLVGRNGGYLKPGTVINIPQREFVGIRGEQASNFAESTADAAVAALKG